MQTCHLHALLGVDKLLTVSPCETNAVCKNFLNPPPPYHWWTPTQCQIQSSGFNGLTYEAKVSLAGLYRAQEVSMAGEVSLQQW